MPDVLPLWVARGLLLLRAHIIGAKFINGIKYLSLIKKFFKGKNSIVLNVTAIQGVRGGCM